MAASVLNQFFDIAILVSLSLEPDGAAVTGHLFQMVSLAVKDPEGCVRSNPAADMNPDAFSRFFNCNPDAVKRSLEVLCRYGLVEIEEGRFYICALYNKKKAEADAAAGRARHARQVREWRDRQKTAKGQVTTPMVKPSGENPGARAAAGAAAGKNHACDANVNPDAPDIYISDISNTSDISNKKIYHISPGGKKEKAKGKRGAAADGNAPAAETGGARTGKGIIPLDGLPEDLRRVVEAWNSLRIKTFTGLTACMRNKLQLLLQQYPLEDVLRAIGSIAGNPFLLGQTEASKNWRITFGWVLNPENCAKLLSGQYETCRGGDGERENAAAAGSGYGAPREWCETYLPGHAGLTPEERKAAFHAWLNPHNAELDEAAAILKVTY